MASSAVGVGAAESGAPRYGRGKLLLEVAAVLGLFAASLAAFPVGRVAEGGILAQLFPFARMGLVLLLISWLLRRNGQSWRDLGLRRPKSWGRAALAVIGGYFAIMIVMGGLVMPALRAIGLPAGEAPEALRFLEGNLPALLYWLALAWTSAAFGEELIARGWLMNRVELLIGTSGRGAAAVAVVAQALVFGIAHAWNGPAGMLLAGAVGLGLGLVYLAGGRNLWPAIVIHGIIDSQSFTAIYLGAIPGA